MSRESAVRIAWTCPECQRSFRIPKSSPTPVRCKYCAAAAASTPAGEDIDFKIPQSEAESTASPEPRRGRPAATVTVPVTSQTEPHSTAASRDIEEMGEQLDQILNHLEGISRTMRLIRKFVWAIGIATLLNILVVGVSLVYSVSMLGSFTSLFSGDGGLVAPDPEAGNGGQPRGNGGGRGGPLDNVAIPQQARENLEKIEEYNNVLNDLLQEVNQ